MASYKDGRAKDIVDLGNHLYTKKRPIDGLHQEIAWQFCPDLASFTSPLEFGEDWGVDRMDGYPEQVSRELSNQFSSMLRPFGQPWFKQSTGDDEADADTDNARFLEYLTNVTRRGIYHPKSNFIGATKEADRFYVNFGQAVISCEEAPSTRDHLYFRNHHIKDCAWLDNELGIVDHLHRKQKMTARAMKRAFREDSLHPAIIKAARLEPYREFEVRFVSMPTEEYDDFTSGEAKGKSKGKRHPYVLCILDVDNCRIIRDSGLPVFNYAVPRWVRMTGSQYAFSPASMPALADARMAQMLSQILLESGEKAVDPPLIGKQEMVIGQPNIAAGGISWVDVDHDGKLSDSLEVLKLDADMRVGFQMRVDLREMLSKAFFLDKLNLPESGAKEMTAFEVARRLEEHVRNLLPLIGPVQADYSSPVLDLSYALLVNMRQIDFSRMPDAMNEIDTIWTFESPLQQAQSRLLVEQFNETANLLAVGAEMGVKSAPIHIDKALRDAVRGVGGPASWRKTAEEEQAEAEANEQQAELQNTIGMVGQGAQAAEQVGKAGQAVGLIPPPAKPGAPQVGGPPPASGALPAPSGGAGAPPGMDIGAMLQSLAGGAGGGMPAGR